MLQEVLPLIGGSTDPVVGGIKPHVAAGPLTITVQ